MPCPSLNSISRETMPIQGLIGTFQRGTFDKGIMSKVPPSVARCPVLTGAVPVTSDKVQHLFLVVHIQTDFRRLSSAQCHMSKVGTFGFCHFHVESPPFEKNAPDSWNFCPLREEFSTLCLSLTLISQETVLIQGLIGTFQRGTFDKGIMSKVPPSVARCPVLTGAVPVTSDKVQHLFLVVHIQTDFRRLSSTQCHMSKVGTFGFCHFHVESPPFEKNAPDSWNFCPLREEFSTPCLSPTSISRERVPI